MNQGHLSLPDGGGASGSSPFDKIMHVDINGEERWSARDLQQLMGYASWQDFDKVVVRARDGLDTTEVNSLDHFMGAHKVIKGGRWGNQQAADYRLTRLGAYQVALAGDSRKPEVAAAKLYFAVQTRRAEVAQAAVPDISTSRGVLEMASILHETALKLVKTELELEQAKPKVEAFEHWQDEKDNVRLRQVAKEIGVKESELRERLIEDHYVFAYPHPEDQRRMQYDVYADRNSGRFAFVRESLPNGSWTRTLLLTPKGAEWVRQRYGSAAA
ncbi:phage antirepressor KilAC domain-containing protein [Streptomyces sp. NBC_01264]|uniref:phage antirepressor KilAC domain-containing protein n=1 Tax=Streptomyces sp. NBC_01264 TaxID=2903804 RepID=UPI00225BFC4B|nr:phage antirepressor KilAC domain-containing protein [Streptomyces sp. NBC_01264]MCX4778190.1 phage antirepressor KilAC domain-containing protein [Streptomyces sp. NBC_01264]